MILRCLKELDHECPDASIQDIVFDCNFLYVAVNRIGIFKWLYCPSSTPVASLMKLMPITQGFHINRLYQDRTNMLLVATNDSHLVKFDTTEGYKGYYKSQKHAQIFDVLELPACTSGE